MQQHIAINNISVADIFIYNSPYGYRLNVNHPRINELYRRYKEWKSFPQNMPLSDSERKEFESYILKKITPR